MGLSLRVHSIAYPRALEEEWTRSCDMLRVSAASQYLKDILSGKVARRNGGTCRFFGEAFVATRAEFAHAEGYYGSFGWLTGPKFRGTEPFPAGDTKQFKEAYRAALQKYFRDDLEALRRNAETIAEKTGIEPTGPDLWLVDSNYGHRFIEVKRPKDEVSLAQLAGLAAIGRSFVRPKVSVELVELHPEREREFTEFAALLDNAG